MLVWSGHAGFSRLLMTRRHIASTSYQASSKSVLFGRAEAFAAYAFMGLPAKQSITLSMVEESQRKITSKHQPQADMGVASASAKIQAMKGYTDVLNKIFTIGDPNGSGRVPPLRSVLATLQTSAPAVPTARLSKPAAPALNPTPPFAIGTGGSKAHTTISVNEALRKVDSPEAAAEDARRAVLAKEMSIRDAAEIRIENWALKDDLQKVQDKLIKMQNKTIKLQETIVTLQQELQELQKGRTGQSSVASVP